MIAQEGLRFGKAIRSVIRLESDGTTVLYERRSGKKKQSLGVRELERMVRRVAEGNAAVTRVYLTRHKRSNRKRRDGWLRDLNGNLMRAHNSGFKKVRIW